MSNGYSFFDEKIIYFLGCEGMTMADRDAISFYLRFHNMVQKRSIL
jgi:hypothetical protein